MIKKISYILIGMVLMIAGTVYAAPYFTYQQTILPQINGGNDLGTTTAKWRNIFINGTDGCLQLTSGLINSTGSACGSGSGGAFPFTVNSWGNSTTSTLGLLNGFLSTASSTISAPLRLSSLGQGFLFTGSGGLVQPIASSSIRLSWFNNDAGFITTDSTASTTLLSDFNTWTGRNNFTYASTSQLDVTGTATSTFAGSINMTGSGSHFTTHGIRADASDGLHLHANNWTDVALLGAGNSANALFYGGVNVTGALSVLGSSLATFPYSSTTYASFGTASTTNLTFGGVTGNDWTDFCTSITGSAGLCDGDDATGAGGSSAYEIATTSSIAIPQLSYFTNTSGRTTLGGVATSSLAVGASITSSGTLGAQVGGTASTLSLNMANANTWTALQTFAHSSTTGQSSFIHASTTTLTLGGVTGNKWSDFCVSITGGADLCDGSDASGAGGGGEDFTYAQSLGFSITGSSTSTPVKFTQGILASTTSQFDNATSTLFTAITGWFTNLFIGVDTLAEYIADTAGAFFTGNTETGITVTYQDADNTVDVVCNTADTATFGCLSASDFSKFNSATTTFTWPLIYTGATNAVTYGGFGTTTDTGIGNNLILYTSNTGIIKGVASSSLSLPNTALQNSTISGIALGSNLNSLSVSGSITGTSYNGSAGVSNWALNMGNANTWTALQTFGNSTTTYGSFATASTTDAFFGTGQGIATIGSLGRLRAVATSTFSLSQFTNDLANLTATDTSLTFSGSYNGSTARTVGLNLSNANTWSVLQTFNYSSSTAYSSFLNASTTNLFVGSGQGFAYVGSLGKLNVIASTSAGFLLDTGDVGTGVYDFGGATSFEIPNAAAPTVGTVGILALDTTSNNLILATSTSAGSHVVVASATTTLYSFTASTTAITSGTNIDMPSHYLPQNATAIWCKVSGGTSLVINLSDGTNDTNTVTCTTTGIQYALTTNNAFTAGEAIRMEYGTKTGDTGYLTVRVLGYRTSD